MAQPTQAMVGRRGRHSWRGKHCGLASTSLEALQGRIDPGGLFQDPSL